MCSSDGEQPLTVDAAIEAGSELDQVLRRANRALGAAGVRVVKFIDENRQIVLASSAAALGARIGTSDATVLRTIQTLGFVSLADLKSAILNSGTVSTPADDMRRTLVDLEQATGAALDGILQAHADGLDVLKSAECRAQMAAGVRVLDGASRIAVFGIGPSSALATYVSILLARNGRRSRTIFAEARALGLATVLLTEANDTPLAKLADVCVAIPRGRPGQMALHGTTLVGLEALVLSLAAAKPEAALASLDNLNRLRRATEVQGKSEGKSAR
jgi:DNA-binding MurR/RpiR family transcriptional regulator